MYDGTTDHLEIYKEPLMSFGNFCEQVIDKLKASYGFTFDQMETSFNLLFENYSAETCEDEPDWSGRIDSTAFSISQECGAAA